MRNCHGIFTTTDYSDYIDFYFDNGLHGLHRLLELNIYNSLNRDKEYSTTTDYSDYIDFFFNNGLRRITQITRIKNL